MNPITRSLLTVMVGALLTLGAQRAATAADDATPKPRGSHIQSPKLDPELVRRTKAETDKMISRGQALWKDRTLGTNGQNCNMCHPNASVTHPETYPKYKQQFRRVVTVQEFINWCIVAAMRGDSHEIGSEVLTALEAYQAHENRGQVMDIGVPGP
jgi:cytochrome c